MTFDGIFSAGWTKITISKEITQGFEPAGTIDWDVAVSAATWNATGRIGLPREELAHFADNLKKKGQATLRSIDKEFELTVSACSMHGFLQTEYFGTTLREVHDPAVKLEFESGSPVNLEEALSQLDDILCILYPKA